MFRTRAALSALLIGVLVLSGTAAPAQTPARTTPAAAPSGAAGTIAAIRVEGNQRIEAATVRSYMLVQPGDPFNSDQLDRSLKTLYATGLFSDVRLVREGNTLIVHVVENPLVNRIAFEGNRKLNDDQLRGQLQLRPRSVFTPAIAQADRQHLLNLYAHSGRFAARVDVKIVKLPQNRVNVVFEINEGPTTLVSRIAFVGNHAFSENRLREVIESREERWWRFLSTSDSYDPQRVDFDKELLRRFYLKNGYADFQVVNASAELAPDRSAFFVTFTVSEGPRYRVAKVTVNSTLPHVTSAALASTVDISAGDWYDGDAVERNVQALTDAVQNRGIAFVEVKPRISRDPKKHTVDLVFDVSEAPRVYVERIDIVGNTRTEDQVIRREFRIAEGDAFNAALIRRSRQALQDLNYFESVGVSQGPGSAPDRTVLTTTINEKATGELTLGGGYSTDVGALANVGLREKNFLGTGIDAGINGIIAQLESSIDLSITDPYFLGRNIVAGSDIFYVNNNLQYDLGVQRAALRPRAAHRLQLQRPSAPVLDLFGGQPRRLWGCQLRQPLCRRDAGREFGLADRPDADGGLSRQRSRSALRLGGPRGRRLRRARRFGELRARKARRGVLSPARIAGRQPRLGVGDTRGIGYLSPIGQPESIVDRFFLGGDNLRGFLDAGAGPHAIPVNPGEFADSIGGRFIWTQSTELRFPLPLSPDLGLSGRTFADIGALSVVKRLSPARRSPTTPARAWAWAWACRGSRRSA